MTRVASCDFLLIRKRSHHPPFQFCCRPAGKPFLKQPYGHIDNAWLKENDNMISPATPGTHVFIIASRFYPSIHVSMRVCIQECKRIGRHVVFISRYSTAPIRLYGISCSTHQSEALPVRETQIEGSILERMKRCTWLLNS